MVRPAPPPAPAAILAGVFALLACGPEPPPRREAAVRFLPAPAEELFDPRPPTREEETSAWELRLPEEARRWAVSGEGIVAAADGGALVLAGPDGADRAIERTVEIAAERVQVLALTLRKTPRTSVELEWAAPGEPFSPDRRIVVPAREMPVGALPTVRFRVAEHPAWRGKVAKIRLTFRLGRGPRLLLVRLAALAVTAESRVAAGEATSAPRIVDLGGDARAALPAPAGTAFERELTVPPAATLEGVYGVAAGEAPVRFRVVYADAAGGAAETLFQDEVEPGAGQGWRALRVDLGRFAGRRARLRLETAGPPGAAATGAWGHPEVLAPAPARPAARRRPPNVLLVSIDTLRADRLSLYGHDRPTSPNLDAWARRRGVVFAQAVASAPWTLPAHTSMFSGLEAHRHGVNFDFAAPASLTTLAERLHGAGYRTLAVTGGGLLSPRFGLAQGFDAFKQVPGGADGDLDEVTRSALAALAESRDRAFFLFVHTYEMHAPYRARAPHFQRLTGREPALQATPGPNELIEQDGYAARGTLRALPLAAEVPAPAELSSDALAAAARDLYDSEVAYTDEHLGQILEALRAQGLERDTVVVVTSDHGEMLGEHGLAGHAYLYDENLLVPLVVATPEGRGAGSRVVRQVRQSDLAPTILDLAGLPVPDGLDGRSLAPLLDDPEAADSGGAGEAWAYAPRTNHGLALRVGGRLKAVLRTAPWPPTGGRAQIFDLARDPGEERPSPEVEPALRRAMVDELTEAYGGLYLSAANAGPRPLTAELRGEALVYGNLHSLDLDGDFLRMLGPYRARIDLPPGRRFTLRLEDPAGEGLVLAAELGGAASGELQVPFAALARPWALAWEKGSWKAMDTPPDGEIATGLVLGWARGTPRGARRGHEGDEALREQLRALGYLQ